jgi:hypothetical protein
MFELPDPMAADAAEGGSGAHQPIAEPGLAGIIPGMTAGGLHKIILPRRLQEQGRSPNPGRRRQTHVQPVWRHAG